MKFNELLKQRKADKTPLVRLTRGQLFSLLVRMRFDPVRLLVMLVRSLLPKQSIEQEFQFIAATLSGYVDGVPMDPATYAEFSKHFDSFAKELGLDQTLAGSGMDTLRAAHDDAMRAIISSDPQMFLRRAQNISITAESLLAMSQLMMKGGGMMETDDGRYIEVPALELGSGISTVKALIESSNSLFHQVREEIRQFEENAEEKKREQERELDGTNDLELLAAYALDVMKWEPEQVEKRLGVRLVEDEAERISFQASEEGDSTS